MAELPSRIWQSLVDRYWDVADWMIGADFDVAPLGFHISVMRLLNATRGDVVLHVRENFEVFSAFVAFRTNSSFARCFLKAWAKKGSVTSANHDNGDLLQMVLDVTDSALAKRVC